MFRYQRTIRLQDTDATGVIYFSEQLKLALEAFEQCLKENDFSLSSLLESPYLLPIVHAEADYLAPLRVDDVVHITLHVAKLGTSSFVIDYSFVDPLRKMEVGKASITHVATLKETKKSTPIPEKLLAILKTLQSVLLPTNSEF